MDALVFLQGTFHQIILTRHFMQVLNITAAVHYYLEEEWNNVTLSLFVQ